MAHRSFDDLVGTGEQRWRHGQPERLGGPQIDDQLELGRLLYWQVGRLSALQEPAGIDAELPPATVNSRQA